MNCSRPKDFLEAFPEKGIQKKTGVYPAVFGTEQAHAASKTTPEARWNMRGFSKTSFVGKNDVSRFRSYPLRPALIVFFGKMFGFSQVKTA